MNTKKTWVNFSYDVEQTTWSVSIAHASACGIPRVDQDAFDYDNKLDAMRKVTDLQEIYMIDVVKYWRIEHNASSEDEFDA